MAAPTIDQSSASAPTAGRNARRYGPGGSFWSQAGWRYLVTAAVLVFAFFPVVYVVSAAFTPGAGLTGQKLIPDDPSFQNFTTLIDGDTVPFMTWMLNSLVIALVTAAGAVFMSALAAYAFSRMRFTGRRPGLLALLLVQMFPQLLAIVALFSMMVTIGSMFPSIGFGSRTGLVLIYLGGALGMNTWLMKGFFDTVPDTLDKSALVDGAGHARIYFTIILPLVKPILAVIGLLTFIGTINDFLIASVMLRDEKKFTVAVGLTRFIQDNYGANWGVFAAGALLGGIPVVILFMFLQRYLVSGLTAGAVKG